MKKNPLIAFLALGTLIASSVPPFEGTAEAQVFTGDLRFPLYDCRSRECSWLLLSDGRRASGTTFVWRLGEQLVGSTLVVGREALDPADLDMEHHTFDQRFKQWLRRANAKKAPLSFRPVEVVSSVKAPAATIGSAPVRRSSNPRTFAVSTRAQRLVADPSSDRHLFHLASEAAPGEPALDHYVMIEWADDDEAPSIRWFVDARSFSELRPRLGSDWRVDERWAVRPLGDGLLTPVDEAVGYEMRPRARKTVVR